MEPTDPLHARKSFEEHYGLDLVAAHNAATPEHRSLHPEHAQDRWLNDNDESTHTQQGIPFEDPPTPGSTSASGRVRTRSGRPSRGARSPSGITKSYPHKSPTSRAKRETKGKLDKTRTPKLTAPLSVLTKDSNIHLRDIEAWVNRPLEVRRKEVENRKGYVARPMNSFMLYRSAYAERTKQWCTQNNHQVVSSVSGESWPLEPDKVRKQFDEWAKTERANHQAAHPNYKFSPSKPNSKRQKGGLSDDEDGPSKFNADPDGEYRPSNPSRSRKQPSSEAAAASSSRDFMPHPYYSLQSTAYSQSPPQTMNPGRAIQPDPLYHMQILSYMPQAESYNAADMYPQLHYPYASDGPSVHGPASRSSNGAQSLGGFGLPSGQMLSEEMLNISRASTPLQSYGQYAQPAHLQYDSHNSPVYYPTQHLPVTATAQMYEHQRYLHQASQPRTALDPTLQLAGTEYGAAGPSRDGAFGQSHFTDTAGTDAYYEQPISPSGVNATLAPTWLPEDLD